MKIKYHLTRTLVNLSLTFLLLTVSTVAFSQNQSKVLNQFKLRMEKTDKGIEIHSLEGSAWSNLSFSLSDNQQQAVDEYGMAELDKSTGNDPKLADFLFTISESKNRVILKGIQGTAWKELSFTLSRGQEQTIDQLGMIEKLH